MITNEWTEIIIQINPKDIELAGAIANMVVPYGIYIEDYSNLEEETLEIAHINLIDEELLAKDRTKAFIHIYISPEENPNEAIAFLAERYDAENISFNIDSERCKQEDWINNWKKYFKPIEVGERFLIRPLWEEKVEAKGRVILDIEPGIAFGTGTHETTRLCMELMEKYMQPKSEVLDIGCGSGILSVAALLIEAETATGVDIDKLAVKTAIENARVNNVESKFNGVWGNLTDKIVGKFDLILANIVADVLIDLCDNVSDFMKDDTIYIISGIVDIREDEVIAKVSEKFEVLERKEEKGWVAMALKQKLS